MKLDEDMISKAISTRLWIEHPFLANMALRLGVNYVRKDDDPAWAWSDGLTTYINISALEKAEDLQGVLTVDNIYFLVGHELLHIINLTNSREHGRNHTLWNMATDYEINDLLITNSTRNGIRGVGKMPQNDKLKSKENPEGLIGLYESKYHGMSAEQIYDELIKEFPPMPQSFGMGGQDDDQQQNGGSGNDQDQSNSNGKGQSGGSSNMAPNGSGQRLLDDHDREGQNLTQAQINRLKAEISQTVKSMEASGQGCGKGCSTIYDRMAEWIFKEPPVDWRSFLNHYLKSWIKDDYTWRKPSRRSQGAGVYLPTNLQVATIKIALAIDTSGSVGDKELQDFMSHIHSILKCFKRFDLDVWCFSGNVHEDTLQHYDQTNADIRVQKISSTGSTDIASNFKFLDDRNEKYDVFIILTDGCDNVKGIQFSKCPTIWGIIDNKNFVAPVGVTQSKVVPIEFD